MTLKEFLRSLSQKEREDLAHAAGCTGAYVTSMIYRPNKATSLPLAVEVDKWSKGQVDFRAQVCRAADVDWDYVRQVLNQRPPVVIEETND